MPKPHSYVYFIQSGEGGPIKIGISTDVPERLFALQAGNPVRLHLIGAVPGGVELEELLHTRFATGRIHREWFRLDTPELGYVARYVFERGELPPWFGPEHHDPMVRSCERCGWMLELELAERHGQECWRCLSEAAESKNPASENLRSSDGA